MWNQCVKRKVLVAVTYIALSACLTTVNKELFSNFDFKDINALVFAQQLCSVLVLGSLRQLGALEPADHLGFKSSMLRGSYAAVLFSFLAYVLTSIHALRFVSVPLYTTLRKCSIVTTVILETIVMRKSFPNTLENVGTVLIVVGAVTYGFNDLETSLSGYVVCLVCNLATSAYLVSISHHKNAVQVGTMDVSYQVALPSVIVFGTISLFTGEIPHVFTVASSAPYVRTLVGAISLAFLLNVTTISNTSINSPTVQVVCANLKDVLLIIMSLLLKRTSLSLMQMFGVILTLIGSAVHGSAKMLPSSPLKTKKFVILSSTVFVILMILTSDTSQMGIFVFKNVNNSRANGEKHRGIFYKGAKEFKESTQTSYSIPHVRMASSSAGGKGDALVTYDSRQIEDTPDGDFIFYTFLYNKVLETKNVFAHYRHFHGRDCVTRPDILEREDRQTKMDPHWCRIIIIWQLLDEGFDRVLYIDTDVLLVNDFSISKFIFETETLTDFMSFQNASLHGQYERSLHGICIKEGGTTFITSGLMLFLNTPTSYQILKDWLASYATIPVEERPNDQRPLFKTLTNYPHAVSLTCSRARWYHYFNGVGDDVRKQAIRKDIAALFSHSLSTQRLVSPFAHLQTDQQDMHVSEHVRSGRTQVYTELEYVADSQSKATG